MLDASVVCAACGFVGVLFFLLGVTFILLDEGMVQVPAL